MHLKKFFVNLCESDKNCGLHVKRNIKQVDLYETHRNYVSLRFYDYILFFYDIIKTTCFFFWTKKADFKGGNTFSRSLVLIETPACALTHCHLNPHEQWSGQFVLFVYIDVQNHWWNVFHKREKWFSLELQAWFVYLGGIFVCAKKRKKFSLAIVKFYRDCLPFTWVDRSAHCFRQMVNRIKNR